jgi:DNA modification methylase
MGIGSTGIAAGNTGLRIVGIEKDAKFSQITTEVLSNPRRVSA